MNSIICCIAKLETPYIREWVDYHLNLGFKKIRIYDNDDTNVSEPLEGCLSEYVANGLVEMIDFRGLRGVQLAAYDDCFNNADFDWCAFIDCDEFITFSQESGFTNINDYLSSIDSKFDVVHLNWQCYGDNGKIFKSKGSVQSRFSKPILPLNWQSIYFDQPHNNHIKSIIRKNADIRWANCTVHTPTLSDAKICNGNGKEIHINSPFYPYNFETAYIRHYATKSLQEFICQKITRQAADSQSKNIYSLRNFYFYNKKNIIKHCFAIVIMLYTSPSKWHMLIPHKVKQLSGKLSKTSN